MEDLFARRPPLWATEPPTPPLPDEEWTQLEGSASVASSPEVRAAIAEAHQRANVFVSAVGAYTRNEPGGGVSMEEARAWVFDAIDAAEVAMREELVGL